MFITFIGHSLEQCTITLKKPSKHSTISSIPNTSIFGLVHCSDTLSIIYSGNFKSKYTINLKPIKI